MDIKYFAKLSKITLSEEEEQRISLELSQIFNYASILDELAPLPVATEKTVVLREDVQTTQESLKCEVIVPKIYVSI